MALAGLSTSSWSEPPAVGRPDELRVQKLAWAAVRFQLGETALFIDPLINPDVWGSALADPMIPVDVERGDRFVLVTHRHPDHFDPLAVREIVGDSGVLVCDSDVAPFAAGQGFKVRQASLWEPVGASGRFHGHRGSRDGWLRRQIFSKFVRQFRTAI
jgi:L-ascorbate metabolism protein UlaG (beta-lactamase superfamily)